MEAREKQEDSISKNGKTREGKNMKRKGKDEIYGSGMDTEDVATRICKGNEERIVGHKCQKSLPL